MSGFDPKNPNNWYKGDWSASNMRYPDTEEINRTQAKQNSSNCQQYQFPPYGGFNQGSVMEYIFGRNVVQNMYGGTNVVRNYLGSSSGNWNRNENLYGAGNMQNLHGTGGWHVGGSDSSRGDYSDIGVGNGDSNAGNVDDTTEGDERQEAFEDNEAEEIDVGQKDEDEGHDEEGQVAEMDIARREGNIVQRKRKRIEREKNPQWGRVEDDCSIPQLNQGMWNLPRPSFDLPPRHVEFDIDPNQVLAIGSVFYSKSEMQERLVEYLMDVKARFKTYKSDPRRYWVRCANKDCRFEMRARGSELKMRAGGSKSLWVVYKFVEHNCVLDPTCAAPLTFPSKHLGKIMAKQIVVEANNSRGDYSNIGVGDGDSNVRNVDDKTEGGERQEAFENNEAEESEEVGQADEDEGHDEEGQVAEMDVVQRKGKGIEREKIPQWERVEDDSSIPQLNRGMWNLPRPSYDLPPPHADMHIDPTVDILFAVGSVFNCKLELLMKLAERMRGKAAFRTHKSNRQSYWVRCTIEDCQFEMRAQVNDSLWVVSKFVEHNCVLDPTRAAKSVQTQYQHMMLELAREIRWSGLYGNENSSFNMLPSFLYMLKQTNRNTVTDYVVDQNTRQFKFAFFALGASIAGFHHTRPIIVINGRHLKGKYKGFLFVAVTKDGNNKMFPLAFGVGSVESRESWKLFLLQLRRAFKLPDWTVIISHGSEVINSAVGDALPTALHAVCCKHIQQNLAQYGKTVVDEFTAAAYSYTESDYNMHMDTIRNMCPPAYEHLKNVVGEARFARVKSPVRRYDFMTSDVVKSMYKRLLWARRLPICALFDAIPVFVGKWFAEHYNDARESTGELTEWAQKELLKAMDEGANMTVSRSNTEGEYHVSDTNMHKTYSVEPKKRICSCQKYQQDLIPCAHAAAVIRFLRHEPTVYVAEFYKLKVLKLTWCVRVVPMPHPKDWLLPYFIASAVCLAPDNPSQAGCNDNPGQAGYSERGTRVMRTQKCLRCDGAEHNSERCNAKMVEPNASTERRPLARKRCRSCGV